MRNPQAVDNRPLAQKPPMLQALNGMRPERTPVWFMRQAGRSLPEYREVRKSMAMMEACLRPEVTCEITLQPVRRHGVDAAILFSDIVVPLFLAGIPIRIEPGRGPVMEKRLTTSREIDELVAHEVQTFDPIEAGVRLIVDELSAGGRASTHPGDPTSVRPGNYVPLLGFAGAPFTLASYLVEGGASKTQLVTRALMKAEPQAWDKLATWCAKVSAQFLAAQINAGVQAFQLFDSWAGSLSKESYRRYVLPYTKALFTSLDNAGFADVSRIHFAVNAGHLTPDFAQSGARVISADWRQPLSEVAALAPGKVLQGNLDPATLFLPKERLARSVKNVLDQGQAAPAHIFNLGHGVPPEADPGVLTAVVDMVHEYKSDIES